MEEFLVGIYPFQRVISAHILREWIARHPYPDLTGIDLSGFNLYQADLSGVVLAHAKLIGATLVRANLYGASLFGANLSYADLFMADLRRADLSGCSMGFAILEGTRLDATSKTLPISLGKWRKEGLVPDHPDGGVLVWKHVTRKLKGNLGRPYAMGTEYTCASMVCAGPWGAIRDYDSSRGVEPYVLAIRATSLYDFDDVNGIYYALRGVPVAVYEAKDITEEGCSFRHISGEDALIRIEGGRQEKS